MQTGQLFSSLFSELNEEQWRIVSVLACERKATLYALERLGCGKPTIQWLIDGVGRGLLLDGGVVYGLPYARSYAGERAVALAPEYRPLVLRHMARQQTLAAVRADAQLVAGEGALAGFVTTIYAGDLAELERQVTALMRRSMRAEDALLVRQRLHEALCSPFDPEFHQRIWGKGHWRLVEQVLFDARVTLTPVRELCTWAWSNSEQRLSARLLGLLAEHAFLRDDADVLDAIIPRLPLAEQLPFRAAHAVLSDNLPLAQRILDELGGVRSGQKLALQWPPSIVSLLCLLALGQAQDAQSLAKRLLQRLAKPESAILDGWPIAPFQTLITKSIRSLMKRMTQPDSERLRLSPHHHGQDAPAWETIVLGMTVLLEECDAVTRLSWTRRLVTDGQRWREAGYAWMARQALQLAKALCPEEQEELRDLAPCRAGELLLAFSLDREPDWRRALRALEQFAEAAERSERTLARRVAWFLDMASGELAKPALEEYRDGTGWTRGRRVEFDELRSIRDTLPQEDVAVLTALDAAPGFGRIPPETIEALCGHPRVFDGARGRQSVEVARGQCRVVGREERGFLVIQVTPLGATEGVHVVVESDNRVVVYRVTAAQAKLVQLLPTGIRIPNGQRREGLVVLSRLAEQIEVDCPELGAFRRVAADASPCIRISPDAGAFWVEVGVRPFGEFGRFFPPGIGRSSLSVHSGEELFDAERNLEEERTRFEALVAQCPTLKSALEREIAAALTEHEPKHSASFGEEDLYALLVELRGLTPPCSLEWQNCRAIAARGKMTAACLHGSLRRTKGWYLVDGQIKVENVSPMALGDLLRMPFTRSGRFLRLPTGDFVEVERRIHQLLTRLRHVAQLPARGATAELKFPDAAFELVRDLATQESGLDVEASAADHLARIDAILATQPPVPGGLCATLRSYQLEGFEWLWRYSQVGLGVCLADDMGLGKTLQAIALLLCRAAGGPALVVAPTSVCSNWLEELRRFAPSLAALEYTGKARANLLAQFQTPQVQSANVLIVSYALLQQNAHDLAAIKWHTAILDEAQFIKNPHSLRAKAAFSISADYRIAMTGTPIENHLGDLWSIFHFLNPSLLGSFKHFQLAFLKPIERDRDSDQQVLLNKLVQPFLLRRRKDEVLRELPPVTTLNHEVRMTEDEALRYALLRRQIHDKLYTPSGKRDHKLEVLAEITKLRRFCCHPRLVSPDAPMESSKVQAFLSLVEELRENGHRALVFSQFVDFLEFVREELDARGLCYQYLDGATPKEARQARVRAFQAGEGELFLISLKAGGFGINLTGADYVIHLDPWWNPAVEAQATDRAHRIGQERPVTVYRLVVKSSIEEQIVALHQEKRAIADALLNDTGIGGALNSEELLALLRFD